MTAAPPIAPDPDRCPVGTRVTHASGRRGVVVAVFGDERQVEEGGARVKPPWYQVDMLAWPRRVEPVRRPGTRRRA